MTTKPQETAKPETETSEGKPDEEIETQDDAGEGESEAEGSDKPTGEEDKARVAKKGNLQGALNEERSQRKKLAEEVKKERAEREKIAQELATARETQEKFNKRMAAMFSGDEGGSELTFEQRPAEFLKTKTETLEQQQRQLNDFFTQQRMLQEIGSFAQSDVARVKTENADYDDAYGFLRNERVGEIMAIYECSDVEAAQKVNDEELAFVIQCAKEKRSPAKALYAYAKKRGYKPASEGGAAKLNTLQSGIAGSKSLSGAAGKATGTLTMEDIAAMSDEEFAAFKAKNPKKVREIMGSA